MAAPRFTGDRHGFAPVRHGAGAAPFRVYVGGAQTGQIAALSSELAPLSNEDIDAGHLDVESGNDG